jgi:hypothetical protein
MDDPGAGTHPLDVTTVDHTPIAIRVSMHQRSGEHPGDDLDASMRMIGIAGTGPELVVVAHEQRGEGHVVRVVMVSEGEAVVGDASGRLSPETLISTSEHDARLGHLSSIAGYGGRMPARPTPEAIAPAQESVWDYPRPPSIVASDEQILIRLEGVDICETNTSWRILETSHPPTYYLPRQHFPTVRWFPATATVSASGRARRHT